MKIFGRIFKSISYYVEKELHDSIYSNEVFLRNRLGYFERNIFQVSTFFLRYVFLTFSLAIVITILLIFWKPWLKPFVIEYLPNWKELISWQGTLLAGQLTLVGVVYPLVVSLVSIFLQNKSAKKLIFPMYQKYSGFMFAGLSGLGLSIFILVGGFFRAGESDFILAVISISSTLWLLFNLLLTAWFLVVTFKFLDENKRQELIFRLSFYEACEGDLRRNISRALLNTSVDNRLLVSTDKEILQVRIYAYNRHDFQALFLKIDKEKSLKNIRFRVLNYAIWLQTFISKFKKVEASEVVINPYRVDNSNQFHIADYKGFSINPVVKFLFEISFSFGKSVSDDDIGISNLLNNTIGSAYDALREEDVKEFSNSVNVLASQHREIVEALSYTDRGNQSNWLFLQRYQFGGGDYLDQFLFDYQRLGRQTVELLLTNTSFFKETLYFYQKAFSGHKYMTSREARSLMQGSYSMWFSLIEWESYNSESGDFRVANKYEDVLYSFIGVWESWLFYIEPRSIRSSETLQKTYPHFLSHLEFTSMTIISALRFGNFKAAGWGVDMLLYWFENLSCDIYWNVEYQWRSRLVNHCFLTLEQTDDIWVSILKGNEFDYKSACEIAFKNAHLDIRVITACYMLKKPETDQSELLITYIKNLLEGRRIHPTSSSERRVNKIENAGELIGAYIRYSSYDNIEGRGYNAWLNSILGSFGSMFEEKRISGRIYTGWGVDSINGLDRAFVEIAIYMSDHEWALSRDWHDAIFSDFFSHESRKQITKNLRKLLRVAGEIDDSILMVSNNFEDSKNNFIKSLSGIISVIDNNLARDVIDAEIDDALLKSLAESCSNIFPFSTDPKFPFSLFEYIEIDNSIAESAVYKYSFTGCSKEQVASGVDTHRIDGNKDWIAGTLAENLKINILRDFVNVAISELFEYISIDQAIEEILTISESMALPIILVNDKNLLQPLARSVYDSGLAKRYKVSRHDGYSDDYICHIGRCEVYKSRFTNIDYSLLSSKELFKKISFRELGQKKYLDMAFQLNAGSDTEGALMCKYWMEADLDDSVSVVKFQAVSSEEE